MRWDELFADLESQLERELTAEEADLEAEEERLRLGRLSLRERIRAAGGELDLWLTGGAHLRARPVTVGRDWFSAELVDGTARRLQCIVPLSAVAGLGLPVAGVPGSLAGIAADTLTARLGLAFVLRDLCRRRSAVELELGASSLHGTIDRVGRDHIDLAVHEPGSPRRASAVGELRVIALHALQLVRLPG